MTEVAPRLARALVRWQRAAGPYWSYVCAAPFLGAIDLPPPRGIRTGDRVADRVGSLAGADRVAVFLDLPAAATLPAAPALALRGFFPVPVVQRWPEARAVLPSRRLVGMLVDLAARLRRPTAARGVVFFLDGERLGRPEPPGRAAAPRRPFDNRYAYRADRFPPANFLRHDGIAAVHWLGPGGIAPDLVSYARSLTEAGIPVRVESARVLTGAR